MTVRPQGAGGDPRHPAPNGMVAAVSWDRAFSEPIELPKGKKLITLRDAALYITKLPKAEHDAGPADPLSSEMGLDRIGPCRRSLRTVPNSGVVETTSRIRLAFAAACPEADCWCARSPNPGRSTGNRGARQPHSSGELQPRALYRTVRRPAARGIEGPFPSCEKAHLRERRRVSTTELCVRDRFSFDFLGPPKRQPSEAEGSLLEAYLHPTTSSHGGINIRSIRSGSTSAIPFHRRMTR